MKEAGNSRRGDIGLHVLILLFLFPLFMHTTLAAECTLTPNPQVPQLYYPDVSGDSVVWLDKGSNDLFLYNLSDGNETRLTSDGREKMGPLISGPLVVWLENPPPYSLILLNLTTGNTRTLSTDAWTPAISGNLIAWVNYTIPSISLYDAGSGEYSMAAAEPHDQVQTAISGSRIIWVNGSDPVNSTYGVDIFMKDLTTGSESLVAESLCGSSPYSTCMMDPQISGERVVWSDYRENPYIDVYLLNLTAPPEVKLTATDSTVNPSPKPVIDGDLVAWVDYPNISLYSITAAKPFNIISSGVNYGPRISGNRVVYYKDDQRIYLSTIGSSDPCPSVSLSATPRSGVRNLTVQFTDTSITNSTHSHWLWDFGDGAVSYEKNPVHNFTADVTYSVSLTVSNSVGRGYVSNPDYIRVGTVPIASFSANQTYGIAPLPVQFTDTSSGDPTSWSWNLGDGNTSHDQNPVHAYGWGTYTVSLSATNTNGTGTGSMPDLIRALNGTNLQATTDIDGLQVAIVDSRREIALNTTKMFSYIFDPGSPASFSFTPPLASGWQRMTFTSTDGIGFARDADGIIRGNYTSCFLESLEIIPTTFGTDVGNNLPVSYRLDLSEYPVTAEINATIWEHVIPADDAAFRKALAETSRDFTSIIDTAYTLSFVSRNLTGVQSATLNLSVSPAWVLKNGNQNNIAVVRLGDDLVNQTLNPTATFTDTANNLDYFVVPSPRGLSRFALVSAVGSSNLIQMGARVAAQLIQSSGGGHSSNDLPAATERPSQPGAAPVERMAATYYGEGKIDTTPAGITRDPVIITSEDRGVNLAIDAGTEAFDSSHHPLTRATAKALPGGSVPRIPGGTGVLFTGIAYDVGPDGATFNPPATIRFTVPASQWDRNTEYSIRTFEAAAGSWEEIPTVVDPGSRVVSGQVSHLCLFGLFAVTAAEPPTQVPVIRTPAVTPREQPKPLPRTPMGTFTGMLGWIYATSTSNIPVSFTIVLLVLAAIYASTRRAWLSRNRTWITLYLISLTGLLWAFFLAASGGPLWESAWILITVTGLNLIVHILRFDRIDLSSRASRGYGEIGPR